MVTQQPHRVSTLPTAIDGSVRALESQDDVNKAMDGPSDALVVESCNATGREHSAKEASDGQPLIAER